MEPIGDLFQQRTKYVRDKMPGKRLDWASQPPLCKDYPEHENIELPAFETPEIDSLLMAKRKACFT
jgi:hypothetical protein